MKATNVEIEEAKDFLLNVAISDARVYSSIVILCEAADETLKYRDALRFRSFDELPEAGRVIEKKDDMGNVYRVVYENEADLVHDNIIGWRYPVGDLVGGEE